jgi:hypothetical protein
VGRRCFIRNRGPSPSVGSGVWLGGSNARQKGANQRTDSGKNLPTGARGTSNCEKSVVSSARPNRAETCIPVRAFGNPQMTGGKEPLTSKASALQSSALFLNRPFDLSCAIGPETPNVRDEPRPLQGRKSLILAENVQVPALDLAPCWANAEVEQRRSREASEGAD